MGIIAVIIFLAILMVTFFFILRMFGFFASQTDDKVSEELCRATNAAKLNLIPDALRKAGVSPQACQKIELKNPLPSGEFASYSPKYGVQKQVGELSARCWQMWQEGITGPDGNSRDVLDSSAVLGKDCFVCYTFSVQKGAESTSGDLSRTLAFDAYTIVDGSDKCVKNGGGYCREKCEGDEVQDTSTNKCENKKCCFDKRNECISRGGQCRADKASDVFFFADKNADNKVVTMARTTKWSCAQGACFVPQKQFISYVDYIQEGGKGPGMLALSKQVQEKGLQPGTLYAVAFNEDTSSDKIAASVSGGIVGSAGCIVGGKIGFWAGGIGGGGVASGITAPLGAGAGCVAGAAVGAGVTYIGTLMYWSGLTNKFGANEFDQILIAERSEITDICVEQYGAKS